MGLYYRLPGILADLALITYALITLMLYKTIPITLTLPGVAGFILSIGMAVDANILIFERLKEELRSGRALQQAIDLGWSRAWPSIRELEYLNPHYLCDLVHLRKYIWCQYGEGLLNHSGTRCPYLPVHSNHCDSHLPASGAR